MILWIFTIIVVIGGLIGFVQILREDGGDEAFAMLFMAAIVWAVIGLCVISMIGSEIFGTGSDKHFEHDHHIVSLSDGEGTYGHIGGGFFFVTGNIGSRQFYSWYERNSDGSYESHQVATGGFPVKVWEEPAGSIPHAIEHVKCENHSTPGWLSFIDLSMSDNCETEQWDLYVPTGTITREFKLDGP